jgi:hypothetical protein
VTVMMYTVLESGEACECHGQDPGNVDAEATSILGMRTWLPFHHANAAKRHMALDILASLWPNLIG